VRDRFLEEMNCLEPKVYLTALPFDCRIAATREPPRGEALLLKQGEATAW
jgi:hypothetical protein